MIDLHTHSTASDGTFSPAELVRYAKEKGISALALTDHDTIDGLKEAQSEAIKEGIEFIPGIELTIQWPTGEFHMLGLGLRCQSAELKGAIDFLKGERNRRNMKMAEKLRENGVEITYEEVYNRFKTKNIGRPHFASYMVEKGIVKQRQVAFDKYFAKGRPCYVDREGLDLEDAVKAVKTSGGIPVQAHPLSMYVSWGKMDSTMTMIRDKGVMGLEAWHPGVRISEAERLEELGKNLGMVVTAGSDFHGEKLRADRHIGFSAGKLRIQDRFWLENLKPALQNFHGNDSLEFAD